MGDFRDKLILPRLAAAPGSPVAGQAYYDTALDQIRARTSAAWIDLGASGGGGSPVVITPPQLTANADDYAPTGYATADVWRVSGDASFRVILGLAGGTDGRIVRLANVGTNTLLLRDKASTTAANQFEFNGMDVPIFPWDTVELQYDGTTSRWRLIHQGLVVPELGLGFTWWDDAFNATATDRWVSQQVTGTGATHNVLSATAGHPGIIQATTGTTATGRSGYSSSGLSNLLLNASSRPQYYRFDMICRVPVLSNATQRFAVMAGLSGLNTGEPTDGLYFYYRDDINAGAWTFRSRKASANTDRTTAAVAAATWYHLAFTLGPDNVARGYVNGTQVGADIAASQQANISSNWMYHILKSVGTTASLFDIDAWGLTTYMAARRS